MKVYGVWEVPDFDCPGLVSLHKTQDEAEKEVLVQKENSDRLCEYAVWEHVIHE